jgi:hypothetical protein
VVIFTDPEKVGNPSKPVAAFYVNPGVDIHRPPCLWKSLVDKVVDNVENSQLSTGILIFSISSHSPHTMHTLMHKQRFSRRDDALRYRLSRKTVCQNRAEKLELSEKPPSKSVAESFVQKNICGNQRKAFGVRHQALWHRLRR